MELPGLTSSEARARLRHYGYNEIAQTHKVVALSLFLRQFSSPLIMVLFVAAFVALILGDKIDAILIVLIVFINGLLGFYQEYKAEKILQALKKISSPSGRVFRDGQETEIPVSNLVPGDIAFLERGAKVPADGKLLEAFNFELNEAALTGESASVFRDVSSGNSQIFLGTEVVGGRAIYEILTTGMRTRFGKIAAQLETLEEEKTPLEKEIESLGKKLGVLALISAGLVFLIGVSQNLGVREMFVTAVSLAVAAVPEGLPAIITTTLAFGVQRMVGRRSVVKRLGAIEALGAVEVICTDKTGTLTTNEMRVRKAWLNNKSVSFGKTLSSESSVRSLNGAYLEKLLKIAINSSTASLVYKEDKTKFDIIGEPMDGAMLVLAASFGVNLEEFRNEYKRVQEFGFDQKLRLSSSICHSKDGLEAYVKGAPDSVLKNSSYIFLQNKKQKLTPSLRERVKQEYESYADTGLRLMAFGHKELSATETKVKSWEREKIESNLTFVGFVGIADPPRAEIEKAAQEANHAGIRTVVITGDNELTSAAVAKEVGLLKEGDEILDSTLLSKMTDQELARILPKIRIFARATPEDKLRIVGMYQRLGLVTAVTGDGVNDALALKKADVGIAMGLTGTDVAKEASDIIVTDDNYASIVKAIEEGRVIYDNISKAVKFLLSGNLSEILFILLSLVTALPVPLYPTQILWINLVTDGLPALALAVDPKDPQVMRRAPRDRSRKIATWESLKTPLILGMFIGVISWGVYILFLQGFSVDQARTAAFSVLIILQMVLALVIRKGNGTPNHYLLISIAITLFLQSLIVFNPTFQKVFKTEAFF